MDNEAKISITAENTQVAAVAEKSAVIIEELGARIGRGMQEAAASMTGSIDLLLKGVQDLTKAVRASTQVIVDADARQIVATKQLATAQMEATQASLQSSAQNKNSAISQESILHKSTQSMINDLNKQADALRQTASGVGRVTIETQHLSQAVKDSVAQQVAGSAQAAEGVKRGAQSSSENMHELSFASAGATRELIVLAHETLSGNFSRIPGSMLVLTERMNGLHHYIKDITLATWGWVAALAATAYVAYNAVAAAEKLAETRMEIQGGLQLNNQEGAFDPKVIEEQISSLRKLAGVSKDSAEEILIGFSRAGSVSVDLKNKLVTLVGDWAAVTRKEAPAAAAELVALMEEPDKGARKLADTFKNRLLPAQLELIDKLVNTGQLGEAQTKLFSILSSLADNYRLQHLTPLQKGLDSLHQSWLNVIPFYTKQLEQQPLVVVAKGIKDWATAPDVGHDGSDKKDLIEQQKKQAQLNAQIEHGFEVEKQLNLTVVQRNELLQKQAGLVNAANAEAARGDKEAEKRFRKDAAEMQPRIDSIGVKGGKDTNKLDQFIVDQQRVLAETAVKIEMDKNKAMLDNKEISNITYLEKQLQLQKDLDAIDVASAKKRQEAVRNDPAQYEHAGVAALQAEQKAVQAESQIRNEIIKAKQTQAASLEETAREREKLIADDEISIQKNKDRVLLDRNEITNAEYLTRALILQEKIDAVDLDAAEKKRAHIKEDIVAYEKATNDIIALQQKQASQEINLQEQVNKEASKNYTQTALSINQALETTIEDMIKGSKSMSQAFKGFARSVLDDIARIQAKNIAQSLFGSNSTTTGGVGGMLAGLIGLGTSLFAQGVTPSVGKTISGMPWLDGKRAEGGSVVGGGSYLVGERGPELFLPKQSGTILNKEQMRSAGNTTVHMTVNTPDVQSFRQNSGQVMSDMYAALARSRRNA